MAVHGAGVHRRHHPGQEPCAGEGGARTRPARCRHLATPGVESGKPHRAAGHDVDAGRVPETTARNASRERRRLVSLLVVGTVAFDSIETPERTVDDILGGSASHFSY